MAYTINTCLLLFTVLSLYSLLAAGQNLTAKCNRDWNRYLDNKFTAQWARRMWDATGKLESGILEGNYYFEGDYEECIRVRENESDPDAIKGRYCGGIWSNNPHPDASVKKGTGFCIPHTCEESDARIILEQVYANILGPTNRTTVYCVREPVLADDPGAIVAITIMSVFAAIVAVATAFDVFYASKMYTSKPKVQKSVINETNKAVVNSKAVPNGNTVIIADGDVLPNGTHTTVGNGVSNGHINGHDKGEVNGGYEGEIKKFVQYENTKSMENGSASSYNMNQELEEEPVKKPGTLASILLSFSLYTNVPRLLRAKHSPGSFTCLHGIRFISMAGVVWGHTYSMGLFGNVTPAISNFYPAMEIMFLPQSEIFFQMWLIVDTFFVMSGFLVCYSFMKALSKYKKVSVRMMVMYYFHRYWRLTPVYMMVLMMYVTLYHYFAIGPLTTSTENADIASCKEIWWRNLLYIQNLWPPDNFQDCFGHAWYLAIDMQLYIMAPPFIILAYFYPIIGIPLMFAGYCGSVASNAVIYSDVVTGQADSYIQVYIKPWTRANSYFIGMMLGVLMYRTKGQVKIPKVLAILGWVCAISLMVMASYIPYMQRAGCEVYYEWCNPWTVDGYLAWNSLISTMYSLGVAWTIFACVCGYGGFIDSFLSWRAWIPLSRLSYAAYLVHIGILAIYIYGSPVLHYFSHYIFLYQFCGHMVITLAVAFIVSLVFEIPMSGIEKVLLPRK